MTNNAALYGVGKGSAQVIDNSNLVGGFGQLLAKQQAQRQLELKQLTDEQAQLKPDGLRNDADRQDFFNQVNDWRNKAITAMNERDPYKKSLAQSQAQQAYMQAQSLVNQSKQQAAQEAAFGTQLLNPAIRDRYNDDAVKNYLANKQLGVRDPNLVKDFNAYEQMADHTKTLDALDKIKKTALAGTQWGTPQLINQKVGNRNATFIQNSRTVDPALLEQKIGEYYDANKADRKTFMDTYPDIYQNQTLTPAQQKSQAIQRYIKESGGASEYSKPVEKQDIPPDRFYEHYNYELAHPKPGQNVIAPATPVGQQTIPYKGGSGVVNAKNFVGISLPNKNFAGAPALDLNTGKVVKGLAPSDDYSIVGVGDYPMYKAGYKHAGEIAQPNFEQSHPEAVQHQRMVLVQSKGQFGAPDNHFLVPYDKLPANVANQKDVRQTLSEFNKTPVYGGQQQSQPNASYQHVTTGKDAKGNTITIGYKNGKWYDTKTNKTVE